MGQKMTNKRVRKKGGKKTEPETRAEWHLRDVNAGGTKRRSGLMDGGEKRGITERSPSRPEREKENPQDARGRKEHESLLRVEEE